MDGAGGELLVRQRVIEGLLRFVRRNPAYATGESSSLTSAPFGKRR